MDDLVKDFLDIEQVENNIDRKVTLIKLGLYHVEYAPFEVFCQGEITDGESADKTVRFSLKNKIIFDGDILSVNVDGKKETVRVEKVTYQEIGEFNNDEYPHSQLANTDPGYYPFDRHYKKVPVDVTDEEYRRIINTKKAREILNSDIELSAKPLATVLCYAIGIIIIIIGLILAATVNDFGWAIFVGSIISTIPIFVSGEIIHLLYNIYYKLK